MVACGSARFTVTSGCRVVCRAGLWLRVFDRDIVSLSARHRGCRVVSCFVVVAGCIIVVVVVACDPACVLVLSRVCS